MKYKGYIFDIYGTLFFQRRKNKLNKKDKILKGAKVIKNLLKKRYLKKLLLINKSYNYSKIKNKIELINKEEFYTNFINLVKKIHEEIKRKTPDIIQPELEIREFWIRFFKDYYELTIDLSIAEEIAYIFENKVNNVYLPYYGKKVLNILKKFKDENKIVIGIVSNAQFYTIKTLEYFLKTDNIFNYFNKDISLFSYKLGRAKPDPYVYEILIKNLNNLGIKVNESIFIGNDIVNDIKIPSRYGFNTCFLNPDSKDFLQDTMESYESNKSTLDKSEFNKFNNNYKDFKINYSIKDLKQLYNLIKNNKM